MPAFLLHLPERLIKALSTEIGDGYRRIALERLRVAEHIQIRNTGRLADPVDSLTERDLGSIIIHRKRREFVGLGRSRVVDLPAPGERQIKVETELVPLRNFERVYPWRLFLIVESIRNL